VTPSTNFKFPQLQRVKLATLLKGSLITLLILWTLPALLLLAFRWIDPPTTAVHLERRLSAFLHHKPYTERFHFIPITQISPNLQHAVIAAEDGNFYHHHGFDWDAIEKAAKEDMEGERTRGGSTITQQLVKNLFFSTSHSFIRKAAEASLVPVAELVLGKERILELYLNLVEWGPGIYGADAACRAHYNTPAKSINRDEAARLAAILPSPLKRKPQRMNNYSNIILGRMNQMGW
jgi:monofunctional biosynthetic peptidoglycan transglycosylase